MYVYVTAFVFKGGDTVLYYYGTQDLRAAIADNFDYLTVALTEDKLSPQSPLFPYFYYDNNPYDITYNYMISASNLFPCKLALIPSYLFGNSYLCISMCFGFFAFAGSIRLFKAFYHFFPSLYREIAMACIFLPGVGFWSAGLLKDPVTFGCLGFIIYGIVNVFYKKKNFTSSILWILICGYLIFSIKIYILLVLVLSLLIWQFVEVNKLIKDKLLRRLFTVLTFTIGAMVGFYLLQYITSFEAAEQYKLDELVNATEAERENYAAVAEQFKGDSHFTINTSNPVLLIWGGFVATFYRPFIWEINTPIALLSALESAAFLVLTLLFLFRRGIGKLFGIIFSDGRIVMCFVFATVFAVAVGASTANFGALSRYKIPCMPFYLLMLLFVYQKANLPYPGWFKKAINFTIPLKKPNRNVRNRRLHQA